MLLAAVGHTSDPVSPFIRKNDFNFAPVRKWQSCSSVFLAMFGHWTGWNRTPQRWGIPVRRTILLGHRSLSAFLDNAPTYLNFLSAAIGLFVDNDIVQQVQNLVHSTARESDPGRAHARRGCATRLRRS